MDSLIIKKCTVGTLSLGLAGNGTNKNSSLKARIFKVPAARRRPPFAFFMIRLCRDNRWEGSVIEHVGI